MTPKRATATMLWLALCAVVVLVLVGLAASPASSAQAATFDAGLAADGSSSSPAISADGRYVAFVSSANNLSDEDEDRFTNVFVRDLVMNTTTLVSRQSARLGGRGANASSSAPSLSADGRYVAFLSGASNVISRGVQHSPLRDVFVRDLRSKTTRLVSGPGRSTTPWGVPSQPRISADGNTVAFVLGYSVFWWWRERLPDQIVVRTGTRTRRLTVPRHASGDVGRLGVRGRFALSGNGRRVAFTSLSRIYFQDLSAGRLRRLAPSAALDDEGPLTLSQDGRLVAYHDAPSGAFIDMRGTLIDTRTGRVRKLGGDPDAIAFTPVQPSNAATVSPSCAWKRGVGAGRFSATCIYPVISSNGRTVACNGERVPTSGPTASPTGIVTRSLVTGRMACVLCAPDTPIRGYRQLAISGDGHLIAYTTSRSTPTPDTGFATDVYVLDTQTGQTTLVSRQSGPGA